MTQTPYPGERETFLGDGVYVAIMPTGYIRLRTPRHHLGAAEDHCVFLDDRTLDAFLTWLVNLREIALQRLQDRLDGLNASEEGR